MSISWELDEEGGIGLDELLGDIVLQDSLGNRVEEANLFLDSFFLALAEGLVAVAGGGRADIELFDAPISISFYCASDQLTIECKGRWVCFRYDQIVCDLVDSYSSLASYTGFFDTIPRYTDLNRAIAFLSERLQQG